MPLDPQSIRRDFSAGLSNSRHAAHHDYLMSTLRQVVWIRSEPGSPSMGQSKFGGWPDLPPQTPWPSHSGGPHQFIAQFNLSEIPSADDSVLSTRGLLSLFAATRPIEHIFWRDPGYVRAVYTPDPVELVSTPPPAPSSAQLEELLSEERLPRELQARHAQEVAQGLRWPEPPPVDVPQHERSLRLRFVCGLDFPQSEDQRADWPVPQSEARDYYSELRTIWDSVVDPDSLPRYRDHLLGYPGVSSLAYDPTPDPSWAHLLCLGSHPELDWGWHDSDFLHVFVEHERLRRADFSNLIADAG
jgi:hypothetical protein